MELDLFAYRFFETGDELELAPGFGWRSLNTLIALSESSRVIMYLRHGTIRGSSHL